MPCFLSESILEFKPVTLVGGRQYRRIVAVKERLSTGGSPNYQVHQVFEVVKCIGQSKHDAKVEARSDGAKTWAEVGAKIGVYSYATADATVMSGATCSSTPGGRWSEGHRAAERPACSLLPGVEDRPGGGPGDLRPIRRRLRQLEQALNRFAEAKYTGASYSFDLKDVRALGAQELGGRSEVKHGLRRAGSAGGFCTGERHAVVASLQREGGARVKEISLVGKDQLKGVWNDRHTGEARGWVEVSGKGGKERLIGVSPETYQRLASEIAKADPEADKGRFTIDGDKYRADLKQAAAASGQNYEGSHGLRWELGGGAPRGAPGTRHER